MFQVSNGNFTVAESVGAVMMERSKSRLFGFGFSKKNTEEKEARDGEITGTDMGSAENITGGLTPPISNNQIPLKQLFLDPAANFPCRPRRTR